MPDKNPLDDLMQRFSSELKYKVPLGLLPEEGDRKYLYEGIEVALVLYWSYDKQLLKENIATLVQKLYSKELTHKKLITTMKDTIGEVLLNDFYNEKGKEFVVDYVAFTNQWKYQYYRDLEEMYPNIKSFSDIPQSQEEYERVFALLDSRFNAYYDIDIVVAKEEKTIQKEIPTITLKSNQLAPRTGLYEATLPKDHPKESWLRTSGFNIKRVKEGENIGTFGLNKEDEALIVWKYVGE